MYKNFLRGIYLNIFMLLRRSSYALVAVGRGGGVAQVEMGVHGLVTDTGAGGGTRSTLTRTGMIPPVARRKGRCLRTVSGKLALRSEQVKTVSAIELLYVPQM